MNKILVIPDVHGRSFWKDAVGEYASEVDKVIFTGDYHDPYEDEGISAKKSIENLEGILTFYEANKDKVVLLIGNHDFHYIVGNDNGTSRYDFVNSKLLHEIFGEYRDVMKLAYECEVGDKKYLFTHAGLMKRWYEAYADVIGELTVDNLNKLMDSPEGAGALMAMSKYRTFFGEKAGSIIWSDVRERFDCKDANDGFGGWYQIFGHTQLKEPIVMDTWACLDCRGASIVDKDGIKQLLP